MVVDMVVDMVADHAVDMVDIEGAKGRQIVRATEQIQNADAVQEAARHHRVRLIQIHVQVRLQVHHLHPVLIYLHLLHTEDIELLE